MLSDIDSSLFVHIQTQLPCCSAYNSQLQTLTYVSPRHVGPDLWGQTLQLLPAETQKKGYLRLPSLLRVKLVPSLSQGTAPPGWGWWQLAGPVPVQLGLSPWHGAVQGCHCMRGCHQQVTVLCAVRPPIAV